MASTLLARRSVGGNGAGHVRLRDDDGDDASAWTNLLSRSRQKHQVRIQGRLVLVRSASAAAVAGAAVTTVPLTTDVPQRRPPAMSSMSSDGPDTWSQKRQSNRPSLYGSWEDIRDHDADHDRGAAVDYPARRRSLVPFGRHPRRSDLDRDTPELATRDQQRRGYGIGGAGNIRRPTDVLHFYSTSKHTVASVLVDDPDKQQHRWHWGHLLGRRKKEP